MSTLIETITIWMNKQITQYFGNNIIYASIWPYVSEMNTRWRCALSPSLTLFGPFCYANYIREIKYHEGNRETLRPILMLICIEHTHETKFDNRNPNLVVMFCPEWNARTKKNTHTSHIRHNIRKKVVHGAVLAFIARLTFINSCQHSHWMLNSSIWKSQFKHRAQKNFTYHI